jgi:hypothetical protein
MEGLQNLQATALAGKALAKPALVSKSGLSVRALTGLGAGAGVGGPVGAAIGLGAGLASEVPAVQSALARGSLFGSDVAGKSVDPAVLQSLFGLYNSEK